MIIYEVEVLSVHGTSKHLVAAEYASDAIRQLELDFTRRQFGWTPYSKKQNNWKILGVAEAASEVLLPNGDKIRLALVASEHVAV